MRAGFLVTTEQGQIRVDVTLAEWMRLGRREGRLVADLILEFQKQPNLETLVEMMHWSLERQGIDVGSLEDFAATIVSIDGGETGDPKVTTKQPGNTSPSPSKSKPARIGQTPRPKKS